MHTIIFYLFVTFFEKKIEKNNNDKIREINNLEKKHQNEKEIENKKHEGILNGISLKTKNIEKRIINLEIKIADLNKIIANKEETNTLIYE